MKVELDVVAHRADTWLREMALPLWSSRGFDAEAGLFEEQLSFDGNPVTTVPRRVMVQCRQISVFAAASLSGRFVRGGDLALRTMRRTIEAYHEVDGRAGWVFSIDRASGAVVDAKRDLYAHAFVLFALAWVMRIERDPVFDTAVDSTLAFLDRQFADPLHGGYWDCLPRSDRLRRQNPHMHLFEALIALYETTKRADVLARARDLRDLAVDRFLDLESGALREYFTDDWCVHPRPGEGSVEPGHLFEWAWLLRQWQAVSGEDQTLPVSRLLGLALRCGFDGERGRIVDEISEDGTLRRASSRSWPHAEALKSLAVERCSMSPSDDVVLSSIFLRLCDIHFPRKLNGLWVDCVDEFDGAISLVVPASSLYHIYFGITSVAFSGRSVDVWSREV